MLTLHLSWSKKSQISFLFSTAAITFSGRQFLKSSLTWQNILLVTCKIERICYTTSNQMQTDNKRVTSAFSYCARAVWNFYWYVYVNIIWICKKWMMHIVEIHGELVRNLLISAEYFFLSNNYKWDLEKVRSQILLTDLKILWRRVMMSCFGCILLNWSIKLLAINIDISHIFQTGSWHLRFPHSPPLTSQYVSAMIGLFCQVKGH